MKRDLLAAATCISVFAMLGSCSVELPAKLPNSANRTASAETRALPKSIERAAIATRSGPGRIAGARIGQSDHFIVYIDTPRGCGSGGCRAQIWTLSKGVPVRKESIAVGRLPIVLLPAIDKSMPRIGITISTPKNPKAILPIAYDGAEYSDARWDQLLAPGVGRPLITDSMLKPYFL